MYLFVCLVVVLYTTTGQTIRYIHTIQQDKQSGTYIQYNNKTKNQVHTYNTTTRQTIKYKQTKQQKDKQTDTNKQKKKKRKKEERKNCNIF
jgi:uncharacterized membrane protein